MPPPQNIETLLQYEEDKLLELFAREERLVRGAFQPSPSRLREAARAWFSANAQKLRLAICKEQLRKVSEAVDKETRLHLVIVVSHAVSEIVLHEGCVLPLSVLVVKSGLENFCQEAWQQA